MLTTIMATINLPMNFHQVPRLIRPRANSITIPEVGATKLEHLKQIGKAVIIKLPLTLTNSPKGAMIPIVALARPDEDGIKNDIGK